MRKSLMISVVIITAIIIAATFDLHIADVAPRWILTPEQSASALFVCPVESFGFDGIAAMMRPHFRIVVIVGFFLGLLVLFGWLWGLYQSLLKDKFQKDFFFNVWKFTKIFFWGFVLTTLLTFGPNSFRAVRVGNSGEKYVLCDSNSPNNKPVKSDAVRAW